MVVAFGKETCDALPRMELRHLRYFVAVAEALSFTKGAQKLRLAQPSLTRQVRNLEDGLGVRLLDRTNNKIAPKKSRLRLSELAQLYFIGMSTKTHPGAREWLLDTCLGAGFTGRILQGADGEPTAFRFVADGLGVALVPEQITALPHDGVAFRPLSAPLRRESTIAWRAENPSKPL